MFCCITSKPLELEHIIILLIIVTNYVRGSEQTNQALQGSVFRFLVFRTEEGKRQDRWGPKGKWVKGVTTGDREADTKKLKCLQTHTLRRPLISNHSVSFQLLAQAYCHCHFIPKWLWSSLSINTHTHTCWRHKYAMHAHTHTWRLAYINSSPMKNDSH